MNNGKNSVFHIRSQATLEFWRRYKKHKSSIFGMIFFIGLIIVAIIAPLLTSYDPSMLNLTDIFLPPSNEHLFGTDHLGRDIFSRIVYGTRSCLSIGIFSAIFTTVIGIFIGGIAGYFGGYIDDLLMRITEIFLIIPRFFLILVIVSFFGMKINLIFVIGITSWPGTARIVRAQFLSLKERGYVEAAKLMGAKSKRIIIQHLLPNALPPIMIQIFLNIGGFILTEASLSFLGLGDTAIITWGQMLYKAQLYVRNAWWMSTFPGIAIFLTVLSLNLIGDGLNDALNPKLKER